MTLSVAPEQDKLFLHQRRNTEVKVGDFLIPIIESVVSLKCHPFTTFLVWSTETGTELSEKVGDNDYPAKNYAALEEEEIARGTLHDRLANLVLTITKTKVETWRDRPSLL